MESPASQIAFKNSLKLACIDVLRQRIHNATLAMEQAQDSANNQEKSSAGDKHETSRAIGQAESEMNARQLKQAREDLKFLEDLNEQHTFTSIAAGALFEMNKLFFFVAVGLGSVQVNGKTVMVISHLSPLFINLKMKRMGDKVIFQNKEAVITGVY